ncbi:MAG: ABC transporter permease [Vicinamibacterales bacterium]|nr:ABC transporter permease [Vicinamibacterales bacterium]
MTSLLQDLRHALRNLRRTPGFAAVTVLTLALGIGANSAIFSVVNGVILRPLGYPQPDQLMFLTSRFPAMGFDQFWVSPPEYFEFREINASFAAVGAFTTSEVNVAAADRPRRVTAGVVDAPLLEALGVAPRQGRWFTAEETIAQGPAVAMLSSELWQSAFGGRADIVGQTIEVSGLRREVVGIMPPAFDVMDNKVDLWLPLQLDPANRQNRGNHFLYLVGRLKDGITPAQADGELQALLATWGERTGATTHVPSPDGHALQMEPVQAEIVGSATRAIWVLQAAVAFVLLIACANLANLLLARAETRHKEFALRLALGAGRWRLLRQFMTEGLLLSVSGGVLGLVLAGAGVRALVATYPDSLPRATEVTLDPTVLGFTLLISIVTGAVFGLAPLLHASSETLVTSLKEGGAKGATSGARHHVRRGLVVVEVALAVMLVAGAGLMLRTVVNLMQVDSGFDRGRLATFALDLPQTPYPEPASVVQFYERLMARLEQVPGVTGLAGMSGLPPNRRLDANDTTIEGYVMPGPDGPFENVDYYQFATWQYFDTMGIPLVNGRGFTRTDITSGPVVVINETMARTFYGDQNPVGRRVRPCCGDRFPWFTIIGVARDVKQGGVDQETGTELYFMAEQAAAAGFPTRNMNVVVRSTLPASALAGPVEAAVGGEDATLPVIRLRAMDEVFAEAVSRPRLLAHLLGAFAGLALLLAAIGTYGILSYMVTERRREIGIRMALGAARSTVLQQVMGQGLWLTAAGLAAGIAGALALNRVLASLLFEVQPTDPATFAGVALTITVVALIACFLPAHRATRVDPMLVLRDE